MNMKQIDIQKVALLGTLRDLIRQFEEEEGVEKAILAHRLLQHEGFPVLASVLDAILEDMQLLEAVLSNEDSPQSVERKKSDGYH